MGDFDDFVVASDQVFEARGYKEKYNEEYTMWVNTRVEWHRRLSSRTKGSLGEAIIEAWALNRGLQVSKAKGSSYDRLINGKRIEIKTSWLWKTNEFKFEQIRLNQDYDYLLMLGIMPQGVRAWIIPKCKISHIKDFIPQHGGKKADNDNLLWISIDMANPAPSIEQYGNSLSKVYEVLSLCMAKH